MKKSFYIYIFVVISILFVFFVINHLYGRYILYQVVNNKRNQLVDLEVFSVNKNVEGTPINLFYSNFILSSNSKPKFKLLKDFSTIYFDEYELAIPRPLKVEPINMILLEKSIPNMTNWFTNEFLLANLNKNSNFDEAWIKFFDSYEMSIYCL